LVLIRDLSRFFGLKSSGMRMDIVAMRPVCQEQRAEHGPAGKFKTRRQGQRAAAGG
jgi:hypothetical protein